MVETFHQDEQAQILLLSYTNRAVDEIANHSLSIRPKVDFIRIGSELSCDEAYRSHLIENELSACMRRSESDRPYYTLPDIHRYSSLHFPASQNSSA